MHSLTQYLSQFFCEMVRPIPIEPALDNQIHGIAEVFSRDFHTMD